MLLVFVSLFLNANQTIANTQVASVGFQARHLAANNDRTSDQHYANNYNYRHNSPRPFVQYDSTGGSEGDSADEDEWNDESQQQQYQSRNRDADQRQMTGYAIGTGDEGDFDAPIEKGHIFEQGFVC
ncbi:unnamed protein product [Anisakis simplex]|uniref:Secreted protein n=1 Tax=Anisakis simplex TaxID=6269 RepID=A0A0M3KEP3_ANISI|nr:unnamed protein product [Anisakis simplex]